MVAAYGDYLHSPSLFLYYLGGSHFCDGYRLPCPSHHKSVSGMLYVLWGERLKLRIKSNESSTLEGVRNHLFMPDWKP